jgi:hypothetical protein
MKEMCFIWKYTSKNVSRYFLVILTIALIVLLTLPTLPQHAVQPTPSV